MYGLAMITVLAVTGGGHLGGSCGGCGNGWAGWGANWGPQWFQECHGYTAHGNYAIIPRSLFAGTPGASVSAEEQRSWDNYINELDAEDRASMREVWAQSDFKSRKKLLGLLDELRKEQKKKEMEEAPITEKEQAAWDAHVKALKGDALKKAADAWNNADNAGKRKLLQGLKK
jgi:hypothetical protein